MVSEVTQTTEITAYLVRRLLEGLLLEGYCNLYGVVHRHVGFYESHLRESVNSQQMLSVNFESEVAHLIDIGCSLLYR